MMRAQGGFGYGENSIKGQHHDKKPPFLDIPPYVNTPFVSLLKQQRKKKPAIPIIQFIIPVKIIILLFIPFPWQCIKFHWVPLGEVERGQKEANETSKGKGSSKSYHKQGRSRPLPLLLQSYHDQEEEICYAQKSTP